MKRRGSMLVELLAAAVLLAAAGAISVELAAAVGAGRRALADRQLASQEAANLMERLAAMPVEDLTSEAAHTLPLSAEGRRLSGAKAAIETTEVDGPPRAIRVAVSIQWEDRNGNTIAPIRLVAWRYP
jgi:hypothetical protein